MGAAAVRGAVLRFGPGAVLRSRTSALGAAGRHGREGATAAANAGYRASDGLEYDGGDLAHGADRATRGRRAGSERRRRGGYGFGGERKARLFAAGFLWGLGFLGLLVGAQWGAGYLAFDGRVLFGDDVLRDGAIGLERSLRV